MYLLYTYTWWLSEVIIWKGIACVCICMSRNVWSKKQTQYTKSLLFSYIYYLLIRCLDYGFIAFVGFALIFIFIASAWNYCSYVFLNNICMCEHLLYPLSVKDFCYYVWKKGFHFPFLFRDIFWRWAGCEASLIFRRSCTRAGKLIRKSMESMIITRIIRTSLECWCRRETRQLNPVILEMREWGVGPGSHCKDNGQALRKLRARSMTYKKRDRKKVLPPEADPPTGIWEQAVYLGENCRKHL